MVKILDFLEGVRKSKGITRKQLADVLGGSYTKEKVDKIFEDGAGCPRAETIAEIMEAMGLPTYPSEWFRSKRNGNDD